MFRELSFFLKLFKTLLLLGKIKMAVLVSDILNSKSYYITYKEASNFKTSKMSIRSHLSQLVTKILQDTIPL